MRTSKETIDYILALAKKQGLSRRELAKKVGISESAISRYANYSREFPVNDIGKFAEVLGVHTYEILDIPFPKDKIFPTAEGMILAMVNSGTINREVVDSKDFQDRLFQAILTDLRQLTKE